jgi:hypothetical protein
MTTIVSKWGLGAPSPNDLECGELGIDVTNHAIYTVDADGFLIKLADGDAITSIAWGEITGKPTEFPPSSHGHEIDQINGLNDVFVDIDSQINQINSEIGAIATTLAFGGSFSAADGKIVKGAKTGINDGDPIPDAALFENTFLICAAAGDIPETQQEGDWLVSNGIKWVPITYSSGSAGSVDWGNIQNKPDFDNLYAPISHNHVIDDVNGLQDALDAKPDADHKHVIDDVTGLQDALDAKANMSRITGGTY